MSETLSFSKAQLFKNCQRAYYWQHQARLSLRAQKPGRRRGTAFTHALFVARAASQAGEPVGPAIDAAVEDSYDDAVLAVRSSAELRELEVEIVKVQVMALAYVDRYGIDQRRETLYELPLVNPFTGHAMRAFTVTGKIDGLLFYGEPRRVDLIEDKFTSQITPVMVQRVPLDEQITEYVEALAQHGWPATRVRYRHTRVPSINPEKAKTFKTKPDKPEEPLDEFRQRLTEDVEERTSFYMDEQVLYLSDDQLRDYKAGRWVTAKEILEKRRLSRSIGMSAFPKNTSKCLDFGGCEFLPLCEGQPDAIELYVVRPDRRQDATSNKEQ